MMENKELLSLVNRIIELMVGVSTHLVEIEKVEEEYRDIYYKLHVEFEKREYKNPNPHSSLWDFYNYWSNDLPTYQSRRMYVRKIYKDIEDKLNIAIEKQKDGKKVLTDREYSLGLSDLHEDLLIKCENSFKNEEYDTAVMNAMKLVESKVREKAKMKKSDIGVDLMHKVFDSQQTKFLISEDSGEVNGWKFLFAGAMGALKNPQSHDFEDVNKHEAFLILCFASLLLDFVDNLREKTEIDDINIDDIPL